MKVSKRVESYLRRHAEKFDIPWSPETIKRFDSNDIRDDTEFCESELEEMLKEYKDPNTKELIQGAYLKGPDGKFELLLDDVRDQKVGLLDTEYYYIMGRDDDN